MRKLRNKLFNTAITAACVFALVGCGSNNNANQPAPGPANPVPAPPPAPNPNPNPNVGCGGVSGTVLNNGRPFDANLASQMGSPYGANTSRLTVYATNYNPNQLPNIPMSVLGSAQLTLPDLNGLYQMGYPGYPTTPVNYNFCVSSANGTAGTLVNGYITMNLQGTVSLPAMYTNPYMPNTPMQPQTVQMILGGGYQGGFGAVYLDPYASRMMGNLQIIIGGRTLYYQAY